MDMPPLRREVKLPKKGKLEIGLGNIEPRSAKETFLIVIKSQQDRSVESVGRGRRKSRHGFILHDRILG